MWFYFLRLFSIFDLMCKVEEMYYCWPEKAAMACLLIFANTDMEIDRQRQADAVRKYFISTTCNRG